MFEFACEVCGKHSRRIAHVMPTDPGIWRKCGGRLVRVTESSTESLDAQPTQAAGGHSMTTAHSRRARDAYLGCLLGGAVGDALGAPIEFLSREEIRRRFGRLGVTTFVDGEWPAGAITDDTQMTLFTAEALIRALHSFGERDLVHRQGASILMP
jgi:hypothetical protein